jgi:hypothetical protein
LVTREADGESEMTYDVHAAKALDAL